MLKKILKKAQPTEEEFRLLYDMFYSRVYRDVFFIVRDPYIAQDALQETFIKVYKYLNRIDDREKMGAWISTIATRTAIDILRKRKVGVEIYPDKDIERDAEMEEGFEKEIEQLVENQVKKDTLIWKIEELKPEYREVILLKHIHEMSIKEIAVTLVLTESTVKTRLHRARRVLKERIETDKKSRWIGGGIS
ncbi:RNA polymerase sigma factor [Saliterribacillus persicus]|uniref:RNA polymerase sigma-70 factor (ECF subfamily) n=1 Tax=Saliterribacillus persicus TaxID=930114 RepID=A0A368XYV2_9BACI|nr:RNA polymerase sigma factor [Saliterribacillus persicus]RCW73181.1 RNA polymerase sigma-70 factor (ECF subfamily) [Saliterribacillus persicus]